MYRIVIEQKNAPWIQGFLRALGDQGATVSHTLLVETETVNPVVLDTLFELALVINTDEDLTVEPRVAFEGHPNEPEAEEVNNVTYIMPDSGQDEPEEEPEEEPAQPEPVQLKPGQRRCAECGEPIDKKARKDMRFCSSRCYGRYYRKNYNTKGDQHATANA